MTVLLTGLKCFLVVFAQSIHFVDSELRRFSAIRQLVSVYIVQVWSFVTGSAKTRHNHASLNLQYKALNTLGEILAY